jgi:N-sulfoglucosamine sulfohydrolase
MVSHIDIFPTICELLEMEQPSWLQGISILPLVNGTTDFIRDEICAEVNCHAAYEPMRCVRTTRWKYIKRFDGRTKPVLPNCDDGLSKTLWMESGWADIAPPSEALYDVILDPAETNNLVKNKKHKETLKDMRKRLKRWMKETSDPLLEGPVPAPPEARVNNVDGISPHEPVVPARA